MLLLNRVYVFAILFICLLFGQSSMVVKREVSHCQGMVSTVINLDKKLIAQTRTPDSQLLHMSNTTDILYMTIQIRALND